MRQHTRTGSFCAAVLLVGGGACSSNTAGDAPGSGHPDAGASTILDGTPGDVSTGDGGDDAPSCVTLNFKVDAFSLGMKKMGNAGLFTFELANTDPAPPNDPQMNTWTIKVLDSSGAPVTGSVVSLPSGDSNFPNSKNPWMPTMHHGSSIVNTITNNGDGSASLQIYFSMSGLWQTYVMAQSGSMTDAAMFSFCLP